MLLSLCALALHCASLAPVVPTGTPAQEGLRTRRSKESIVKSNTQEEIAEAVGTRILKLVEDDQDKAYYEKLEKDLKEK